VTAVLSFEVNSLERLIERNRPPVEEEDEPAGNAQLGHLNRHGLMPKALDRQLAHDGRPVVSKRVAWEVLADAQRRGLHLRPTRERI
jgi:hypothetical protein